MTTGWSSSTPRSSAHTKMRRAEKGDQKQCTGSFSRWVLHKDPRARRLRRSAAPRRAHAGTTARVHGRRADHRKEPVRASPSWRHWVRLPGHPRPPAVASDKGGHSGASNAQEEASARPKTLRPSLSRRVLFPRPQALPGTRNALRENGSELPRAAPLGVRPALAGGLCTRCLAETWDSP